MKINSTAVVVAAVLSASVEIAAADTISVDLGQSAQNFTLYGQGPIAPGIGSFKNGQGSGVFDSGTNSSTFTLSGTITSGSPGYNSGTYDFITTYAGQDTPQAGPNAPFAQSNPSNLNFFFYNHLDPSTTMTLELFGAPTGDHVIPLVVGGSILDPDFFFLYTTASCTGVAVCTQNNVGLTPGATISGPVTITASFVTSSVPEPATWGLMLIGLGALGLVRLLRLA
jgi:hypothetical protein